MDAVLQELRESPSAKTQSEAVILLPDSLLTIDLLKILIPW